MNNVVLALPDGDFERLDEETLNDPRKRTRFLQLTMEKLNFDKLSPPLRRIVEEFGRSQTKDKIIE